MLADSYIHTYICTYAYIQLLGAQGEPKNKVFKPIVKYKVNQKS